MLHAARGLLVLGTVLLVSPLLAVGAGGAEEMVVNPYYKHWANFKPGATVTVVEKTVFGAGEKDPLLPDGVDQKAITSKLLSVKDDRVVVQVIVTEREFLGFVELAPTKTTYLAKVKKSHLQSVLDQAGAKQGEQTVIFKGEKIPCKTLSGTLKKDGMTVEHKLWLSDKVPGGIVKRTRVTKQDGKLVADTTITLKSFKAAE